jgi:hypothetical protein
LKFEGAIYHLTSLGDRRVPIFEDDLNQQTSEVVEQGVSALTRSVLPAV